MKKSGPAKTYEQRKASGQQCLMVWLSPKAARALASLTSRGGCTKTEAIEEALVQTANGSAPAQAHATAYADPFADSFPALPVRRPKSADAIPFDELPLNGLLCSVCSAPQRECPSGSLCSNGHGGAEGIEPGLTGVRNRNRARRAERVDLAERPMTIVERIRARGTDRTAVLVSTGEVVSPTDPIRRR